MTDSKTIEIKTDLEGEILFRAIQSEIRSLVETMNQCDTNDSFQSELYNRAKEQYDALDNVRKQLMKE